MADQIASFYGKPLIRGLKTTPEHALRLLKTDILRRLRRKLVQSTFSERAKKSFSKALSVKVGASSLTILADHPAFIHQIRGQKQGQMRWLVKARAPIPIITESGELIFRTATARSMADGKWVHPGRAPYDFIEKAKEEAKTLIRKKIVEEIRKISKQIAKRGRGGRR
jgi:hypothetical protein